MTVFFVSPIWQAVFQDFNPKRGKDTDINYKFVVDPLNFLLGISLTKDHKNVSNRGY